jgi:NADH:ubiquinone oxidoreductase subunit E
MDTIAVCMGSSCFSKGSAAVSDAVRGFVERCHLQGAACVRGRLCGGACGRGPNIYVNDKLISGVPPDALDAILSSELSACNTERAP